MRVRLTRRPGQWGTKTYVRQYGDRLVCVRYRYDAAAKKRYKTIELIVDEQPWQPPKKADELVALRVGPDEYALQKQLREAGAAWKRAQKVWVLRASRAAALGLGERIIAPYAELKG
jgi:hypothetical protein